MNPKLLTLVCGLAAADASAQQKPVYPDTEAAKHVGEEATVKGRVFSVFTSASGTTFLNFGNRYPRQTFSGVIFASKQALVGDANPFEGKEVLLTGRIEMSRDQKPQIIINRADQIQLATTPANSPAPPPTVPIVATPAPAATVAPPAPSAPMSQPKPVAEVPVEKRMGKIQLRPGWDSPRREGETTRKDLARLLGWTGSASEATTVDTSMEVYPGIPFLTPLSVAEKTLKLEDAQSSKSRVATPGLPQNSFNAHLFNGVFPGGFSRLYLVTDVDDRVVSVLMVDSSSRTRVPNEPDTTGYHTYNFVTGAGKAAGYLVVRHQVTPGSETTGLVVVDTLLIDPTDPEDASSGRTKSSSGKSSFRPKSGKVLERSRWHVPGPVVNLILRCVGG